MGKSTRIVGLNLWILVIGCILLVPYGTLASFLDYIWPPQDKDKPSTAINLFPTVPYEVSEGDEAFLKEASKWIGLNLSKLDLCHHRVILKLKNACHQLNAEQLGKLAVMLLNCQSDSEGRRIYQCDENMSLKECTGDMDPDTWNAYHLVTNRAKAVCSSVRHDQFRGLTEITVNKLMDTAHEQIQMMGQLAENQKELQSVTQEAIDEMASNNDKIISQQGNIMRLSEAHRAKVESNFRDLVREKSLIRAGQQEVAILLTDLRNRIDESVKQLDQQSKRSKLNHASLLSDMESLQKSAATIATKIDETGSHFVSHHRAAEQQFQYTLEQLEKINRTVDNMLAMIGALQKDFDQKLSWITEKIGGSDYVLQKINSIVIHFCYLIFGMICLSFVGADKFVRVFFILVVPGNLLGNLLDMFDSNVLRLTIVLSSFILADLICRLALRIYRGDIFRMGGADQTDSRRRQQREVSQAPQTSSVGRSSLNVTAEQNDYEEDDEETAANETMLFLNSFRSRFSRERSVTPLANGTTRSTTPSDNAASDDRAQCNARTLRGDQCRSTALAGRDFCRIHDQRGL
ncbi:protein brambleberry-like [Topomyia yanbarensis]|uniref:protein brambleberry-like n=1 Tax=Topomyia yanbarensis TaxID=2498891 RepID=UPI00273B43C6|nr:protein brambleberry-like [Topomyia yanbarensis]XP_058840586.1 protein brambleberry-like [Topomyia yanbarensis]